MIELFNPEEWEQITQTPYLVFKYTAGIDGKVDSKEIAAFIQFCENRKKFSSALIKEVLPETLIEFPTVDAYVNTACPRISLESASKFSKPVLTVNEFRVVNGEFSWETLLKKGLFEN